MLAEQPGEMQGKNREADSKKPFEGVNELRREKHKERMQVLEVRVIYRLPGYTKLLPKFLPWDIVRIYAKKRCLL